MEEMKIAQHIGHLRQLIDNTEPNVTDVLRTFYRLFKLTHGGHDLLPKPSEWLNQTAFFFLSPELRAVLVKRRLQVFSFHLAALNFIDINDVIDDLSNEEILKNSLPPKAFNRLSRELLKFEPAEQNTNQWKMERISSVKEKPVIVTGDPLELYVIDVNCASFQLRWNKSTLENVVNGYQIHVHELDPTDAEVVRSIQYEVGVVEEYFIGSLIPDTSYLVELIALTEKGNGARSTVRKVSTPSLPRGEIYQCSQCDFTGKHPSQYVPHIASHWKRGPFKCDHCHYYGFLEILIRKHVEDHHKSLQKIE